VEIAKTLYPDRAAAELRWQPDIGHSGARAPTRTRNDGHDTR
jgi:hypothetical protein